MTNATEDLLKTLSERGYRVTAAREAVVKTLANSKKSLTIQALAKKVSVDEASVYRIIAVLLREGLIEKILVRGQRPHYSVLAHHHHHAICTGCGKVAHLPCGPEPVKPRRVPGFCSLQSHELTFYGICDKCETV